jgi:hypothetical protein
LVRCPSPGAAPHFAGSGPVLSLPSDPAMEPRAGCGSILSKLAWSNQEGHMARFRLPIGSLGSHQIKLAGPNRADLLLPTRFWWFAPGFGTEGNGWASRARAHETGKRHRGKTQSGIPCPFCPFCPRRNCRVRYGLLVSWGYTAHTAHTVARRFWVGRHSWGGGLAF